MDECHGSRGKSSNRIHTLGTYHDYIGAISWVDRAGTECKLPHDGINITFGIALLRPEKAFRLV